MPDGHVVSGARMNGEASFAADPIATHANNGSGTPVMERFGALPESIRKAVARDYPRNATKPDEFLEHALRALRHNGFTIIDALLLSAHFPKGLGLLAGKEGKDLREVWHRIEKAEEEKEAEEAALKRLMRATAADTLLARQFAPEVSLLGSLVTPGSRMFVVGPTGVGKTMLLMAMTGGMITGRGFLGWQAERASRVLFVDGEMPLKLLRARMQLLADQLQVTELPNFHYVSWQEPPELKGEKFGPLNTAEGQSYLLKLCELIRPTVVILDNVQSLLDGDMREEVPWNETQPLVLELTRCGIAQIWGDHTGHDHTRQYGASRKQWAFDTVLMAKPAQVASADLALAIDFSAKARNRSPDNKTEYEPRIIQLTNGEWSWSDAEPDSLSGQCPVRGHQAVALQMLERAMKAHAFLAPVFDGGAEGLVCDVKHWRTFFYDYGMPGMSQDTKCRTFNRQVEALQGKKLIAANGNLIWPTHRSLP
jgi:hypothetical protein